MPDFSPLHSLHNIEVLVDSDRLLVKNLAFPSGAMTFEDSTSLGPITLFDLANAAASGRLDSTGVISGGIVTVNVGDDELFDISDGNGIVVDAHSDANNVVRTPVIWENLTGITVDNLVSENQTFLSIDINGLPVQRPGTPTEEQHRDEMFIGEIGHPGAGPIQFVVSSPRVAFNKVMELADYVCALGPVNKIGNDFGPNDSNLSMNKSAGATSSLGINRVNSTKNTGVTTDQALNAPFMLLSWRDGLGDFLVSAPTQFVDPNNYDDGTGVLATVPNNQWTVQRTFWHAEPNVIVHHYGQEVFANIDDAIAGRNNTVVHNNRLDDSLFTFRGWLFLQQSATDLSNPGQAAFLSAGKLGQAGAGGGGASVAFVSGPNGAVEDNIASFLGISGKEIQDSGITVNNLVHASNAVEVPGRVMVWDNPGSGLLAVSAQYDQNDVVRRTNAGPSTVGSLVITTDGVNQFMRGTDILPANLLQADGSVDLTDVQVGVAPVLSAHLATRGWIEGVTQPASVFGFGSDATPDVTGASYVWTSAAAHTVTDFLGGINGQRITVVSFATALTITHDGTDISLRNNKDAVLGFHDTLTLIQSSGQWKEDGRRVDGQDIEADGSVDFTAEVVVITPTVADSAANMGYVVAPGIATFSGASATFSASLVRVATIDGDATALTDLTSPSSGQEVTLLATGTRTVTHGSGIDLNGNVDYDMVAGDSLTITYNGTDWIEGGRGGQ